MANIAQMINVLQAMILTSKEKMVLTPTYHVFRMYVPFQDATLIPVQYTAGTYSNGGIQLPRVDAIAAKDTSGKFRLAVTNLDPLHALDIEAELSGVSGTSVAGETITADKVDSVNTFETPAVVTPKPIAAKLQGGKVLVTVAPKSVTVFTIE